LTATALNGSRWPFMQTRRKIGILHRTETTDA
jgi:hypothetical protein